VPVDPERRPLGCVGASETESVLENRGADYPERRDAEFLRERLHPVDAVASLLESPVLGGPCGVDTEFGERKQVLPDLSQGLVGQFAGLGFASLRGHLSRAFEVCDGRFG